MLAARHPPVEMLEPLDFLLSSHVGSDWSLNAESRLIHVYG